MVGSWKQIESDEDLNDVVNNGISQEDVDNTVAVDDLYTGSAMTEGIKRYVAHVQKPNGTSHVRPLPINMFIDASHTDLHGSLKTTPISFSVGAFPRILRNKHVNNRNLGYMPNLQAGLGKYANSLDLETYVKWNGRVVREAMIIPKMVVGFLMENKSQERRIMIMKILSMIMKMLLMKKQNLPYQLLLYPRLSFYPPSMRLYS